MKLSFDVRSGRWIASLAIGTLCVALTAPSTTAGPENCLVTSGTGNIHLPGLAGHGPSEWHFHQTSNTAILLCDSFNIGPGQSAEFFQPGAFSRVLTRTTDGLGININGNLWADGFVFFANPAGFVFGTNAVVDVGGIYATAGTILDQDFLDNNNEYTFSNTAGNVTVMNGAVINADTAVHLLGQHVVNSGMIVVQNGVVTMLAGDTVTITEFNNGANVSVTINGGPGSGIGVINDTTGVINAPGSQVILGAGDLYSLAVHHKGTLTAGDVTMFGDDGIRLDSDVTTSDDQTYEDAVIIGDDITLTAGQNATVQFQDTVDALNDGVQSLIVNAGTTDFDGHVGSSARLNSLTVHGIAQVARNVTTTNGILFNGNVFFDGDGMNQFIDAGGGILRADGDLTKAGNGNLTLSGIGGIDLNGNVDVDDGSLTITDDFSAEGNLTASQNVTLHGNGILDGAGNQVIVAETGMLTANGTLTKNGAGNLTLGGATGIDLNGTVDNNVGALIVVDAFTASGDLLAATNVSLLGNGILDGAGNQRIDAEGGMLITQGTLTKNGAGNLTLGGATGIDLNGTVDNNVGALTIEDAFTASGNLLAFTNVTLHGNGILDGAGNQVIVAETGMLTANGTLTKNGAGNLTLGGATGIDLNGTVDNNVGALIIVDAFTASGDLLAATNVSLLGNGILDGAGNQRIDAEGGMLITQGTLTKNGAGNLTLGGATGIDLNGTVDNNVGALTIEDAFTASGNLLAFTNVTLQGNGILDGTSNQRIDAETGMLTANGTLTKNGAGNLTLGGATGIRLDGAVDVQAGDLTVEDDVEINGGSITTSGDQTYEGEVDLGHNTLFEGDDILFKGAIHGHAFDLSVDADTTRFEDIIEAVGHLFVDGVTFIGGDITVFDGMEFGDAVILIGNADLIDLGVVGIIFRSTINGPHLLFIQTGGDALFQGDIGANQALAGFETDVAGFMLFDGADFEIHSTGDVIFNQALNSVPAFATIGSTGHLRIFGQNFTMGQNQKMTVLGDLLINLLGIATLSDINTLGDFIVNASQIFLLSRQPGFVIDAFGNIIFDLGLDFVAGRRFFFSVNPIVLGGGLVQFANPNGDGDALGTLQGFIMRAFGQQITPADLVNLDGVFLDLTAQGPTNANVAVTIAGAVVRESETEKVEQGLALGATTVEELLQKLRIAARPLTASEVQAFSTGRALFDDSGDTRVDFPSDLHRILVVRMDPTLTQDSLDSYNQLVPDSVIDVQDRLENAWAAYDDAAAKANEATTPVGFVAYLVRVENHLALADLRLLDQVLQELAIAGPTRYELRQPIVDIFDDFKPRVVDPNDFQKALEAARTIPEQGE